MFGYHAASQAGRVGLIRGDERTRGDSQRFLRSGHRAGTFGHSGGLLHHEGSLRRRNGGQKPGGPRKEGQKRSVAVDADGIPLGSITAPANYHDSPLLSETLDTVKTLVSLPELANVHHDRGYDSEFTRKRLEERSLIGVISKKGGPAPLQATKRWVVERTNSWNNAHKKLVWCTKRRGQVIDFWVAFSNAIIIVGRLIRKAWTRYRWESRPSRRP